MGLLAHSFLSLDTETAQDPEYQSFENMKSYKNSRGYKG